MTDTTVETAQAVPAQDAEQQPSADLVRLIRTSIDKVESGKAKMSDVWAAVLPKDEETVDVVAVPAPTSISDAHRVLLTRLPEVFGKVNPEIVRMLTTDEIAALSEERATISGLLNLLTSRKEAGIREIIANHFDAKAEDDGRARTKSTPKDKAGHYLLADSEPCGDGMKFTRELRETKPSLDGAALLAAYENGGLTREEYLSCTRETRIYDETKTRTAIKKNPALLMKLRPVLVKGGTGGSIYQRPHKSG